MTIWVALAALTVAACQTPTLTASEYAEQSGDVLASLDAAEDIPVFSDVAELPKDVPLDIGVDAADVGAELDAVLGPDNVGLDVPPDSAPVDAAPEIAPLDAAPDAAPIDAVPIDAPLQPDSADIAQDSVDSPDVVALCGGISCDDKNDCTVDTCVGGNQCAHQNSQSGLKCDDGNPCTKQDNCQSGKCVATPIACECTQASDCVSKNIVLSPCDGQWQCDTSLLPYKCIKSLANVPNCPDTDPTDCTTSVCDGPTGKCKSAAVKDGTNCDDGAFCTADDKCKAGQCLGNYECKCETNADCAKEDNDKCDGIDYCDKSSKIPSVRFASRIRPRRLCAANPRTRLAARTPVIQ